MFAKRENVFDCYKLSMRQHVEMETLRLGRRMVCRQKKLNENLGSPEPIHANPKETSKCLFFN